MGVERSIAPGVPGGRGGPSPRGLPVCEVLLRIYDAACASAPGSCRKLYLHAIYCGRGSDSSPPRGYAVCFIAFPPIVAC